MRTAKRSDDRAILGPRLALAALAAWAAVLVVGSYASKSPWSVKADTIGAWAAGLWETVASVTGSLTRGITVPRYVSACEELGRVQVVITEQGIDPDYALLSDSTRCGWAQFCAVIAAWNFRFPAEPFLPETTLEADLETISAFLAFASYFSGGFGVRHTDTPPSAVIC